MSRFKIALVFLVYLTVLTAFLKQNTNPPEISQLSYEVQLTPAINVPTYTELTRLRPLFTASYGGIGYDWGNCTWYTSIVEARLGHPVPTDLGNATDWASNALGYGFEVKTSPVIGDVAQKTGGLGHVAVVTDVDPASGSVKITEMNSLGLGITDERWTSTGAFVYINFN